MIHRLSALLQGSGATNLVIEPDEILASLSSEQTVLENGPGDPGSALQLLIGLSRGPTLASHPEVQGYPVAPPTIPSILAYTLGALHNANLIDAGLAAGFRDAERQVVELMSELVGYDRARSAGLFTFGGTGTLLYGCKLGLEKAHAASPCLNQLRDRGKIIVSERAHYSTRSVAEWLGIGAGNVLRIPVDAEHAMSLEALEVVLRARFEARDRIVAIVATMGTTDAFGIDDLNGIAEIRDRLVSEFGLDYLPHIHADAVIGWAWSVFRDYDVTGNPLGFSLPALNGLSRASTRISGLDRADSVGIDFHKTGYAPYISSLVLFRERSDLRYLARSSDQMPYLDIDDPEHPAMYSLECSRSGAAPLAALVNLHLFGKQGYRVLIGHAVEMALLLRRKLAGCAGIHVVNGQNGGPMSLIRAYPGDADPAAVYRRELSDPCWSECIEAHNRFNRRLYGLVVQRTKTGTAALLSWTSDCRRPDYPGAPPISALKSCILSPWTDQRSIDELAKLIADCRMELLEERVRVPGG